MCQISLQHTMERLMNDDTQTDREPTDELLPTRASLLARLRDVQDDASWHEFFELYHRLILRTLVRKGLSAADAEDVAQEIFVGVARRLPTFEYRPAQCSFKTWLFRILQYRVAEFYRRRGRGARGQELPGDAEPILATLADPDSLEPDAPWEREFEDNLVRATLERVRRQANPRYFQLYCYCAVEGHSVAETARIFQTPANDVSVALQRVGKLIAKESARLRSADGWPGG